MYGICKVFGRWWDARTSNVRLIRLSWCISPSIQLTRISPLEATVSSIFTIRTTGRFLSWLFRSLPRSNSIYQNILILDNILSKETEPEADDESPDSHHLRSGKKRKIKRMDNDDGHSPTKRGTHNRGKKSEVIFGASIEPWICRSTHPS